MHHPTIPCIELHYSTSQLHTTVSNHNPLFMLSNTTMLCVNCKFRNCVLGPPPSPTHIDQRSCAPNSDSFGSATIHLPTVQNNYLSCPSVVCNLTNFISMRSVSLLLDPFFTIFLNFADKLSMWHHIKSLQEVHVNHINWITLSISIHNLTRTLLNTLYTNWPSTLACLNFTTFLHVTINPIPDHFLQNPSRLNWPHYSSLACSYSFFN